MRKSVLLLSGGNMLSKIVGVGREILMAGLFGTGNIIGAFRIAQTGTLAPANFFTSDSLNAVFVPLYKKYATESCNKAQTLLWGLITVFTLLSLLILATLCFFAELWIDILAPGLGPTGAALAAGMLKVMGIGIPFYLLSALLMFLGMANDDFVPTAVRPVFQNLGLISGALAASLLHDLAWLSWGFTASYIFFSVWVFLRTLRSGFLAFPETWRWYEIGDVMQAFWQALRPLLFLPVMLQGCIVIERIVASLIGIAAISSLDYAKFITETVIILVALPIAQVGLYHWSGLDGDMLRDHLKKILFLILLVSMPVSVFLAVHAELVVKVLYARGAFDAHSISVTRDILFGISLGLWAQTAGYVLVKALNAQLRNHAVFQIMVMALFVNTVCNMILYRYFGPMTLGIGNSAYGIMLLAGTLSVFKLWRDVLKTCRGIAAGCLGYLVFNSLISYPENLWGNIVTAGAFALAYWLILAGTVPRWRAAIAGVILIKSNKQA